MTAVDPAAVTPKHRHPEGGHLLFRPIGLDLFTRTAIAYADEYDLSLPDAVKALRKMPTNLSQSPFVGVIWDPTREVIKSDGKTIAREVMSYMVGLTSPTKALLERYRIQRGFRRNDESVQLPQVLNV